MRVLEALEEGLTNAEIAVRLQLSPETVKWHIGELLAETGATDRRRLVQWWRWNQGGEGKRFGVAWPVGLLRLLPVATAVVVIAVGIRLLVPATSEPAQQGALVAQPQIPEAAQAVSPASGFVPDTWVLDLEQRTAHPVPIQIWASQWYEPGKTLLAKAGKVQAIVDLQGKVLHHFGSEPEGPYVYARTTPIYGKGALIWRWQDATLSYYDEARTTEEPVLMLTPAPVPRQIDFQASPDRARIAYTQVDNDTMRLYVAEGDGANPRLLLSLGADHEMSIEGWSPDSRQLLVTTGHRADCTPNGLFEVCRLDEVVTQVLDVTGSIVWQREGHQWRTHWAGPNTLLIEDQVIAEHLLALQGIDGTCELVRQTQAYTPQCIYTVKAGETLESIGARFGVEPGEPVFHVEPDDWASLSGLATEVAPGHILSIPAPLQGSMVDLTTGEAHILDVDIRGLHCVSPDGRTAVVQYRRGNSNAWTEGFYLAAINLATGDTIVEADVGAGYISCNDKSWTPDGSMVVLSPWGK